MYPEFGDKYSDFGPKNEDTLKYIAIYWKSGKRSKPDCCGNLAYYNSDPEGIRTPDRLLRRQMLYPAELPDPEAPADRLPELMF